jgi:DNA polymerase-4
MSEVSKEQREHRVRRILHVDINSYFATLLQQENPALRGRAVGVVKDEGRTCLIAVSKEAKLKGVKTACTASEARVRAPEIVLVPAAFDLYLDATRRLKGIFNRVAPTVDIFSLDEAFIDISDCERLYPDAKLCGRQIQQLIKQELGDWVTCNVGISHSRLLAKLAGEVSPKGSVTEITPDNQAAYLAEARFESVCGIGMRLERRLARLGISNPYQINFFTETELEPYVGKFWAPQLLQIARGEDSPTLAQVEGRRQQPMKSVSRSITGWQPTSDPVEIKQTLYNLCDEAAGKVRKMGMVGRHVGLYLRGSNGEKFYAHKTFPEFIRHTGHFFDLLYGELFQQPQFPVIKFAVFLSLLKPADEVARSLLPDWQKQERIYQAIDAVNDRYGLFTLRSARLANFEIIRPEVTGFLGDKVYHGL